MIAVVIIGIIAGIAFPRLMRRAPNTEWSHVKEELNDLLSFAREQAITHKEIYRLTFDAKEAEHKVLVETQKSDPQKPEKKIYALATSEYFLATYTLPESIKITAVYKGKQEQFEANKNVAYSYIIPDGLAEDILVHMKRLDTAEESKASFKVQPFFGTFELHDGYLKPEE